MKAVVEKDGKKYVDVVKLLPRALPSGKKVLWERVDKERTKVFVDPHSAPGGSPKPIVVKRFVEINEDLFLLMGLWFGDGIKIHRVLGIFGFSNTEVTLHQKFLELAKRCLLLNPDEFRCHLSFPPALLNNEKILKEEIGRKLALPPQNFYKSSINPSRNSMGIDIKIQSRLLGVLLHLLFNEIKTLAFTTQGFTAAFLQGVIASEANVHVRNDSGRLGEISIAIEGKERRKFIRKLLLLLDIKPSKDKTIEHQESVLIHGLSNFRKVKKWDLVCLHPRKALDFRRGMQGFKLEEYKKGEGKLLILKMLSKKPRKVKEMATTLKRCFSDITYYLRGLSRAGLVTRKKYSVNVFWTLTSKGVKLLHEIDEEKLLRKLSHLC